MVLAPDGDITAEPKGDLFSCCHPLLIGLCHKGYSKKINITKNPPSMIVYTNIYLDIDQDLDPDNWFR